MTRVHVCPRGRVECRADLALPMPAGRAWGQLRDFTRFASHDYFHAQIIVEGDVPRAGAAACIFFHPRYRGGRPVLRPYPPALYVAAAVLCLSAAWFAAVNGAVRREARPEVPGAGDRKEQS